MAQNQITFLDFPKSEFVEKAILKRIEKLEHLFSSILSCRVNISSPHRHSRSQPEYLVEILIAIPNEKNIVVRTPRTAARGLYFAVRDGFDAAERTLKKRVQHLRHFDNQKITDLEPSYDDL